MPQSKVINCPNCGGVVAKEVEMEEARLRCPHCDKNLIIKTKLQVEVYEPQQDNLTRES